MDVMLSISYSVLQKLIAGPCSKDELVELVPQFRQIPYNYVTNLVRCRLENILHDQYFSQKTALEEPELLNVTAECVMNMTEKAILSKYMQFQNNIEEDLDEDISLQARCVDSIMSVHLIFVELAVNSDLKKDLVIKSETILKFILNTNNC